MSQMEFQLTGDANPLLKAFSRVRSAARSLGKDVNNVLQMPIGGAGAASGGRAGLSGGLRGMLAAGIGSGLARLGGAAAGVLGGSALVHRGMRQAQQAADTVSGARDAGMSPSDFAALQIATERYGETITQNATQLVAAMNEIKASGEVLSDVDYERLAADSSELSKSLGMLSTAFVPVTNNIMAALAGVTRATAGFVKRTIAYISVLGRPGPTDQEVFPFLRDDADLNRARASLAGAPEGTAVDPAAVAAHVKKRQDAIAGITQFRVPHSNDPQTRVGLFNDPAAMTFRELVKANNEQLKTMRAVEAGVRRLNDTTKAL